MKDVFEEWLSEAGQRFTAFRLWLGELRDPGVLRADVIAGITVALVLVPQSMAYAQLAGLPPYIGLYASFLAPIVAALFGSSRQLQNGPVAVISLMTAAALAPMGLQAGEYVAYAAVLALMVGVFQMGLGLLRLGVLVDFLSHPVIIGFTNAAAIVIGSLQIGKLFGIEVDGSLALYETYWHLLIAIPFDTHIMTFVIGMLSLLMLGWMRRKHPRLPAALITVVVTTGLSWLIGFAAMGGEVVGEVPPGLPAIVIPQVTDLRFGELVMPAMIIALLSFVEAFSIAKAIASETRHSLSADQEMVGKGLANIAAGLTQGYPVSGSFSRSAVAFAAGAKTGFAAIVSGLVVGLTLLFLTPLLYHLPLATLAAVIIVSVLGLVKFEPFNHAWRVNPHDGFVALAVFLVTLLSAPHLETGIFAGVGLSLIFYLYRTMQPNFAEVACDEDGLFRDAELFGMKTSDTLALFRYDGDLYFANAGYLERRILNAVAAKPLLKVLILDLEAVEQIDATGEEMLAHMAERLQIGGIEFVLTRPKPKLISALKRSGLWDLIGEERIFDRRYDAIKTIKSRYGDEVDIRHLLYHRPLERDEPEAGNREPRFAASDVQ
ncbi:sulfate permease [Granulosicoccaceae sp. 1_MG-2023]|nr:sulfate permease [Granulosicoccaceae sp. 1_MG-2023]